MKLRLAGLAAMMAAALLMSQPAPREQVGPTADGGFLLSSGWRIKAAGVQIPVDTFPMAAAVTPDKKFLLVLNGGYNPPSVSVIDLAGGKELSRVPVPDGWLGLTMTKAGDKVYVGGGAKASVYEFGLKNGVLTPSRVFPVVAEKDRTDNDFIGDVQLAPDGHLLYAADLYRDSVVVINPQSGLVLSRVKTGRRPYRILFHPTGKSFYVSSWADGSIGQYDANTGNLLVNTRVGPHTTDMVWRDGVIEDQPNVTARLFVSASNTNNVYVLGAAESGELSRLETINVALTPNQPLGSTPSGLGLSADGMKLFVACADANAVAVVDVSEARSRVEGFVPAGWYPTTAFGLPDGRVGYLNGKGLRSYANPKGPNPLVDVVNDGQGNQNAQFVAAMQRGTVALVDLPDDLKLADMTREVIANSPYSSAKSDDPGIPAGNPVRPGGPIKHVIYVVKESRTYDQVLGDMKQGNGDPSLALFGEAVTPNLHKLASEFVLLDNFYENSDVGADGHNWAMAAIAPDYTQRIWPSQYARREKKYGFEGTEPANSPPAGYLWTNALQAGITVRNFGEWTEEIKHPGDDPEVKVNDPMLQKVSDEDFAPYDLDYPDADRAREFVMELRKYEKAGTLPGLMIVRLGNDHTSGTTPGKIAPLSAVADNDQAVGMLVEAVSKSRFWGETAIFVIEDDAQNGPDHVDSHRAPAWVASPWVKKGTVNSTMYNQASVLRTMEIILGMRPMTTFDAGARPMFGVFNTTAAGEVYTLEKPRTALDQKNPAKSPAAARLLKMNFKDADEILWAAIQGGGHTDAAADAGVEPVRALMPKIYLCFLWHMHQPFYKDLVSGEYRLPWTRMHALKDYYGMARILEEFPGIRQTFNLVPSMMVQLEEYARGEARDPFLAAALKPAEELTPDEQIFILRNFFMANPGRMINRYPRYAELQVASRAQKSSGDVRTAFGAQDFRDLQVLSQLAWFDEEFQEHDGEVRRLVEKGRHFSLEDQALMGRKQREICGRVIPEYRKLAETGQIEISTTPFYHPILPLLCDSDVASVAHPHVPLPPRFSYPEDARLQLDMARDYVKSTFGVAPVGLWPSEGSVSDHALELAASAGFEWAATDNGVLDRTLRRPATPDVTYRPYMWSQRDRQIRMIFRDHVLSDLIGFVYSGMGAADAAQDFLHRIHDNCRGLLASGRDALVPIILDGENAWEYYDHNGRPFFRELYGRIQADGNMEAITVREAFEHIQPEPLTHIFPGSWINANFDVWIGAEEDNKSWRLLLDARKALDAATGISDEQRARAREEILIAEGSDWNWWYGPEHETANAVEFDQIYREHLANVYRALGIPTPLELSLPILKLSRHETVTEPKGRVSPTINGLVDSYFEWLGAGVYKVDQRSGSMHGKRALVKEVRFGADEENVFLRIDFAEQKEKLEGLEVHAEVLGMNGGPDSRLKIEIRSAKAVTEGRGRAAFDEVMEIAMVSGSPAKVRLSFWQDGLPLQAIPPQDYLRVTNPAGWNI